MYERNEVQQCRENPRNDMKREELVEADMIGMKAQLDEG